MGRERAIDVPMPIKGLHETSAYHLQPPLTTPACQNVRGMNPKTGRVCIAQRPGLSKFVNSTFGSASTKIQDINEVINRASTIANQVQRLAIADGNIYAFTSGAVTSPAGGSGTLSTGVFNVMSQQAYGCIYYVDGTNYKKHTGFTSPPSLDAWTPSAGSLPTDSGNTARLIELWGGRIVLSGVASTPYNWFMSGVGEPLNWDYGETPETETSPVAGNNSDAGEVGDAITGMIPCNDNILIFLCESSIWRMYGNPAAGGRIHKVSDVTGGAWGRAWCIDPNGTVYFFGSQGNVYRMRPEGDPEMISGAISERLQDLDQTSKRIRLCWNTKDNGFHLFITPSTAAATAHFFWDAEGGEQGAWWLDAGVAAHGPVSVFQLEGPAATDRQMLLGGHGDGRIRTWDYAADDDDGTAIDSYCDFFPIQAGRAFSASILWEIQGTLVDDSDAVDLYVYTGKAANEAAAATTASFTGELTENANYSLRPLTRGRVQRIRLRNDDNDEDWALEQLAIRLREIGPSAQRSG